ncbi:MAG: CsgG/HfaB family protein [Planctomycetaceae bacterium]|nr:hypothetical protein [Planctomycetaceae bacterium]
MRISICFAVLALAPCAWGQAAATRPAGNAASAPDPKAAPRHTVFAAPFTNETAQEQYDPAAAGLADLIGVLLAQQEHIVVVERQRLDVLAKEQVLMLRGLSGKTYAVAAGKLLAADCVLVGRVFLVDTKLTVSAQLIHIATDRVLAADQIACRPSDLPEASLQMALRLAKQLSLPLPAIDLSHVDKSPIASLHFCKALGDFYSGNLDSAIMQLMRTIDLDPDFVEAYYWAGLSYSRLREDAAAVIEWQEFLKRWPDAPQAPAVRELLAAANKRAAASGVPRLGPTTRPATGEGR